MLLDIYVIILGVSASMFLFLFLYMLRNNNILAITFAVFSLFNAVYSLGLMGQLCSGSAETALLFHRIKTLVVVFVPSLFALFLYQFDTFLRINRKIASLLFIIPFIIVIFVATNEFHGLYYKDLFAYQVNGKFGVYFLIAKTKGPLFFFQYIYNVSMFVVGLFFLSNVAKRKNLLFKKFSLMFSLIVLFVFIASLLSFIGVSPNKIDLIPFANLFGITVYMLSIFYCNIFGIYELNHNLTPQLSDGIIITDKLNQIIYFNRVSQRFFPCLTKKIVGEDFRKLAQGKIFTNGLDDEKFIIKNTLNDKVSFFTFQKVNMHKGKQNEGYIYVFNDCTEQIEMQNKLQHLASYDALTQIYNQGAILEKTAEKLACAKEHKVPFSIVIFDVNTFKHINDQHGHIFGNEILIEVASNLKQVFTEDGCYFGRFGGDEFLIVCCGWNEKHLNDNINKLVSLITKIREETLQDLKISISVGCFHHNFADEMLDIDYKQAIDFADKAMYQSKHKSKTKNKIYFYQK